MPLTVDQIKPYLESLVPERPEEMVEMERYAARKRFPIIGPAAGQYCYQLARLMNARRIFELGSGYGYSTAWFARAVQENGGGVVHHVVWDDELSQMARGYLAALGYEDIVQFAVREAIQALRETSGPFDLIFSDINKEAYPESLNVIDRKLRSGGVLIVDNMFLSGRVFDKSDQSESALGVREFTRRVTSDLRWIISVVPIRDGLLVAYKQ
jgi:caffeoyl-CoA O-methyltransferase